MRPSGNPETILTFHLPVAVDRAAVQGSAAEAVWHLHYRQGAADRVAQFESSDAATEAACRLIDNGSEVLGIGAGEVGRAIDREQLALIYALWVRVRYH